MMSSSDPDRAHTTAELALAVEAFAKERDWDQFHDPKNLTMAITSEAGEMSSIFRWVTGKDSDALVADGANRDKLRDEIGDVGICLLLLCARVEMDLGSAVMDKLRKNGIKYPLLTSRGRADPP